VTQSASYTPALGFKALTPLYDAAIALLTRENVWRSALIEAIALKDGESLLDVGCGTGTLAVRLAKSLRNADIHGIDPDPDVLDRARVKAARAKARVSFHHGFLDESFLSARSKCDVIASSLVFHQVPLAGKREILHAMRKGLKPGGRCFIADYGLQRTGLMRRLFRATVQSLDGVVDTQPNADGLLPKLMEKAGFEQTVETKVISTLTGSISILTAR